MRNIIRIGAGTDRRNRFVAIALGVALAVGPAAMLPAAALAAPATDAAAASTTAGATITLQGADGASLAGHTFNVYRIGTYTDQILNGTQISSLGVRGDTASNAWAADAIGIANAYDPDTADDIAKVYGYDDAGNIANIKMDSQTRQLRNISKALGQSTRKPAAIQGGANLTTTQSTLTINVPAEGLYYITDSAGNPIMVGTKSGNANIMKNDAKDPQWRTLGVAVVKAKSVRVDKKVQVSRDGATVGKDGTASDPVGVTVGDTVTNTVEVTVPNKQAASAVKFKLIDQPKGQTYVQGSLSVRLKNAPQTDITADAIVYDGTTQNNAKSIPGDPTLKTADNRPADPDLAIPAGGWGIDGRNLLDKYSNRTIVITYRMTVDKASITDPANNTVHTYGTFTDGIRFTTITDQDKVDIKAYDFTLRKVDAGNVNTLLDGARFQIQRNGKWMNLDWNTGKWSDAADQGSASVFVTGDSDHDGTVDNRDDASQRGLIRFKGLGYGTYTVTETREPAGYASYAKPTFTVTIDDAGTSIQYRGTGTVPNLTSRLDNNTVQVKNVANLTQLPQTGGVLAFAFWLACAMPLFAIGGTMAVRGARNRRDALMLTHDGDTPAV
ncbi:prealbumin-like fold domain-containing protein [Bifidobacterium longum]|uniref:prealbumin-like fold domain-containing protein n=1 Tax=Bifidobacterium longum TaxID=216816 RepID=UPI00214AACC7|nr:prealbumin-like fold domain-containing protein [Bifidobacterium longum]